MFLGVYKKNGDGKNEAKLEKVKFVPNYYGVSLLWDIVPISKNFPGLFCRSVSYLQSLNIVISLAVVGRSEIRAAFCSPISMWVNAGYLKMVFVNYPN